MSYLDTARTSLEAIRSRRAQQSTDSSQAIEASSRVDQVTEMSLDQFAQAGLIVRVFSEVLAQEVLFVSDNVSDAALANRTLPIYRAAELRKLAIFNPSPAALRTVHTSKTVFQGRIADVRPHGDL